MRRYIINVAAEIFVWTLLSAFVEVLITATVERLSLGERYVLAADPFWSLQGHTTLWVLVVAVGLTFGLRLVVRLFERAERTRHPLGNRWVQGFVVMMLIYALELVGGLFFNRVLDFHLWDYSQYVWHGVKLHLDGQITLVYAPFWFLAGLFVSPVYRTVHTVAPYVGESMVAFVEDLKTPGPPPPRTAGRPR